MYLSVAERPYKKSLELGTTYQKLVGLMIQKANPIENVEPFIGVVVPAVFIKETIDKLAGFVSPVIE